MLASASNQRYNLRTATRAVSSVVEHILHTDGVTSSNLVLRIKEKAASDMLAAFFFAHDDALQTHHIGLLTFKRTVAPVFGIVRVEAVVGFDMGGTEIERFLIPR